MLPKNSKMYLQRIQVVEQCQGFKLIFQKFQLKQKNTFSSSDLPGSGLVFGCQNCIYLVDLRLFVRLVLQSLTCVYLIYLHQFLTASFALAVLVVTLSSSSSGTTIKIYSNFSIFRHTLNIYNISSCQVFKHILSCLDMFELVHFRILGFI